MNKSTTHMLLVAALALGLCGDAAANEREDVEIVRQTTINLIQALVDKGVLTQAAADDLIKQAEASARKKVAEQSPAANVVRVPYVPESVKAEIREQVKQELLAQAKAEGWAEQNAAPDWVNAMKWDGDIRVRYQREQYPSGNDIPANVDLAYGLPAGTTANTTEAQERYRLRARLGLTTKISSMVSAGVRIATGSSADPVSTNQTLGNSGQKYSLWLDQAYIKLDPIEWLSAIGGRMPNPWLHTDLVWDADLNFDGFAVKGTYVHDDRRSAYLTLGAFPIQHISPNATNKAKSKWLYAMQGGVDLTAQSGSKARLGVALYDYRHVEGIPDTAAGLLDYDATKPQFRQKGNTVFLDPFSGNAKLSSKFRLLNVTAHLDLAQFDPHHLILAGDYVTNFGFDAAEIRNRTGGDVKKQTTGYQLQAQYGHPRMRQWGDWNVFAAYRYLERDAVLDAFTDSDFRLGGTDAKGYILGANLGLDRNTWLSLRWMSADQIDSSSPPYGVDMLQLDLNARF